jgi:hypothetical protein
MYWIHIVGIYSLRFKPWAMKMKFEYKRFKWFLLNRQMDKCIGFILLDFIAHGLNRGL